ncbi:AAA family ATPase [Rothia mucilaginosa]|uniref:AAA family ATPase n=1 Tax=Rothia mucilaginosa TaxID=43675 RepID=UPI0028E439E0|nr:AAA family ATPase [Rothia mucilaginosa]
MVDATKVSSIKIDTGYAGVKEYPLFTRPDGEAAQCAIILGKNGSGKSTLARALDDGCNVEFFDENEDFLDADCSNVYVFNEEYVVKNFRIYEKDSLESIVMLGKSGRILDRINDLERRIAEIEDKLLHLKSEIFNRVVQEEPSIIESEFGGFAIREYIDARIMNELKGVYKLPQHNDVTYLLSDFYNMRILNEDIYLSWLDLGCRVIQVEMYSSVNDKEEQEEIEKERLEISDKTLGWFDGKVEEENDYLRQLVYEFYHDYNHLSEDNITIDELKEYRELCASWLISSFYNVYPKIYDRYRDGFSTENERSMYRALSLQISALHEQVNLERRNLGIERRIESAKDIVGFINQWLYLVFGKKGIYLEFADQFGYIVKFKTGDKEEVIHPNRLSLGEQNILSLCYFFASTLENKNISGFLQENQIIVLDDPVSSFDDSNKYGVTSLLGYLCQSILDKSSKTKLIIMTHDLSFAANMEKMIKAIDDSKLSCLELQKDSSDVLIKSKFKDIDRYADMLGIMYDFAVSSQKSAVVPAPNDVRRVWEAFLSFELGMTSIAEMGAMKKLSESFSKDEKIERFIKIFIPQLFINSDSHSKSQVMNGNLYLTPTLDGKPYEDFVKNIVCFMHLVSPRHIAWRMKKTQEENVHESVAKLDNLVREVLDDPKIVAATSSWQGIQGLRRARHRGGRVPLSLRQ